MSSPGPTSLPLANRSRANLPGPAAVDQAAILASLAAVAKPKAGILGRKNNYWKVLTGGDSVAIVAIVSKKHDARDGIKLWPENSKRLKALCAKSNGLLSVNKLANTVLAFSLHKYEANADWIFKEGKVK